MDESVIDKLDMRSQKDSDECSEVDETEQKTRMPKGRPRKYPVKVGKYKCESCPVLCSKPSILEKHRRVHTDERPYPCPKCQIGFKTISNLNKHLKSKAHLLLEYRQRDETLCEQDAIKLENCRSIISALVDSKSFNSIDDLPNDLDIYSGVLLIQGSEADKKKQTSPTDLSKETTLQPRDFKLSFILYRKDFFEIVNRVKSQSVERDLIAPLEETMQEEKKDSDPTCLKAKDDSHMVKLTTSYESNGVKESRKRHKSGQSGVREQRNNSSVEEEQITRQVKMKIQHKLMRAKSDTYGIMNRPTGMDANNEKPYFGFSLSENDKGYIQETTLRKMEDGKLLDMTCWQGARITTASSGNSSSLSSETLNNESIETPGDKLPQINQQNKIIFEKFLENMKRGGKREGEQQDTEMVKHRLDTGEMVRGPPKKRKFDESSTPSDHQEGDSLTTDAINQQGLLFKALSYHDDNDFMKKMTNLNQSLLNNNNASLLMLAPYYNLLNSNGLFQTSDGQILRNNNNTPLVTIPDILNRKLTNSTQITTSVNSVPSPVAVGKGVDGKKFICCDRNFKSQGDLLKHQKSKPHCDKNGNFMISKRQNSSELNQKPSYYHPAQPPNVNANDFAQEMPINLICQSADQSSLRANFETILKNASNYQEMARQNPNEIVNSERNNSYYINETRTIKCEYCREDVKIRLYQTHILTHHVNGSIQRQTPTNSIEDDNSNEDSRTITPEYFSTGITSSRPHVCNVCGKGFRVEGHLMKHYRSKAHMTSAVQKYGYSSDLIDQVPKEQLSSGDLIDKKTGVLNLDAIERLRKIFNVNNSCNKQS